MDANALVGRRIIVDGLRAKPELNGICGTVVSYDASKLRLQVRTDQGRDVALKPENVVVLTEDAAPAVGIPVGVTSVPARASASSLPSGAIAGNAAPWAVERMQQAVGVSGERLLAVWQIGDKNRENLQRQACEGLAMPFCWPVAICCAPCICVTCDAMRDVHARTIYGLTEGNVWKWVEADPLDGTCMGLPLLDASVYASGAVPLAEVRSISTHMPEELQSSCDSWCPTTALVLAVPPGCSLANIRSAESHRFKDLMVLHVNEPEAAGALIEAARSHAPYDTHTLLHAAMEAMGDVLPQSMERGPERGGAAQSLVELQELRALGLISQAEYEDKKREVLARI